MSRARLLRSPPSIDAGEITDKGYTNQRITIERRVADVALLYPSLSSASSSSADEIAASVIVVD